MEENTKQMMLFKDISGKKVEADFDGGQVSSDAGWLLLRQTESRLGLIRRMAEALRDRRHPSYVKHQLIELFTQRVFQIASGYEDADDCDELRHDPVLKMACEALPDSDGPLASQPTMSRFENGFSRTDLYRIATVFVDVFIDSYQEPPEAIILDIDDTDDPTHGAQQLSLFNAYYDTYCFMPLHIYEGQSGKLITTILRPGKRPSGKEIASILKRIVRRLQEAWPDVGIMLRGDSHYSTPEVYSFCRERDVHYALGISSRPPMLEQAQALMEKARQQFEETGKAVQLFGEFQYQAGTWAEPQRIVFKAEHNEKGPNTRFIVTDLTHSSRRFIYQTVYCGRGTMELMIKDHKNHLYSDRTSCCRFEANQLRLFLHSMAYVLMHTFRTVYLSQTQFAKAQFDTIRLKLLKIGARVRELCTKVKIHLPSSFPYQKEFFTIWQSCCLPAYT